MKLDEENKKEKLTFKLDSFCSSNKMKIKDDFFENTEWEVETVDSNKNKGKKLLNNSNTIENMQQKKTKHSKKFDKEKLKISNTLNFNVLSEWNNNIRINNRLCKNCLTNISEAYLNNVNLRESDNSRNLNSESVRRDFTDFKRFKNLLNKTFGRKVFPMDEVNEHQSKELNFLCNF